jgi:hypothetical protein
MRAVGFCIFLFTALHIWLRNSLSGLTWQSVHGFFRGQVLVYFAIMPGNPLRVTLSPVPPPIAGDPLSVPQYWPPIVHSTHLATMHHLPTGRSNQQQAKKPPMSKLFECGAVDPESRLLPILGCGWISTSTSFDTSQTISLSCSNYRIVFVIYYRYLYSSTLDNRLTNMIVLIGKLSRLLPSGRRSVCLIFRQNRCQHIQSLVSQV